MKRRGQSFVEVLIAVLFLGTGGLVIYTASTRSLGEAEWSSEHVFADGVLRDLVEAYRRVGYCDLALHRAEVKASPDQSVGDDVQAAIEAQNFIFQAPAFLSPASASTTTTASDPVWKEYNDTIRVLKLKRIVLFKETDPANGVGVVTCMVRWHSRAGPVIDVQQSFPVYRVGDPTIPCP
jgi:hypothetical protein